MNLHVKFIRSLVVLMHDIVQTCKTYWRTKKNMQDRSTDHEGAPLRETIIVTPDTVKVNPAGPSTAGKTHWSCVAI